MRCASPGRHSVVCLAPFGLELVLLLVPAPVYALDFRGTTEV